jgi:hypothetical protein
MNPYYYVFQAGSKAPTLKCRYDTLELAQQEAERLADVFRGVVFEIVKVVAISRIPDNITFFLDECETPI